MSVINIDELKEIMDNDSELIQECFADFLMEYPGLMSDIRAAIETKDFDAIDNTAHKLKGSLRYLAAARASAAALAIEDAGRQQDLDGIGAKMDTLDAECQKVILYIDEFSG